jgi:hypothetical protein
MNKRNAKLVQAIIQPTLSSLGFVGGIKNGVCEWCKFNEHSLWFFSLFELKDKSDFYCQFRSLYSANSLVAIYGVYFIVLLNQKKDLNLSNLHVKTAKFWEIKKDNNRCNSKVLLQTKEVLLGLREKFFPQLMEWFDKTNNIEKVLENFEYYKNSYFDNYYYKEALAKEIDEVQRAGYQGTLLDLLVRKYDEMPDYDD